MSYDTDTFDTLLRRNCKKYAERPAIHFHDHSVTYGELGDRADALATALYDLGLGKDDRVGFMMSNRPEYFVSNLAVPQAGGIWVPLNDMLAPADMSYMLSDSRARFVIVGPNFVDALEEIEAALPLLDHVILLEDADPNIEDVTLHSYQELVSEYQRPPDIENEPSDVVAQYYTGGTTGRPKGVLHTHQNFVINLYSHVMELDIQEERMLLMTPLAHSAGLFALSGFLQGSTILIRQEFSPDDALDLIESEDVTWTFMVPTMIYRVLDHPKLEKTNLDTLETLTYGAAPMTPERIREGLDAFGPIFQQFYGQTEIPNVISTLSKDDHVRAVDQDLTEILGSAGRPVAMADVKIVDVETGETATRGDDGEILVRAPYTMSRYFNRPQKNKEVFEGEWLRTGDIGRIVEDGFVTLLDRESDLIITGGMNVYSTEVESVIEEHEGVVQSAVIGVPHDDWGEAVHATVVPYQSDDVSEADILDFCRSRLADYKQPKSVEFVETLPETPYGKIDKKAIREPHWEDETRDIH